MAEKNYPTFDCDAHINDPVEIWDKYIPKSKQSIVRSLGYWGGREVTLVNGRTGTTTRAYAVLSKGQMKDPTLPRYAGTGGGQVQFGGINTAGPGFSQKIQRKLSQMNLTHEQADYLDHRGGSEAKARVRDLDLQGIDQVLVIPTRINAGHPLTENVEAAKILCEAYNNWAPDWCSEAPDRLFPAGILPIQDPFYAAEEVERIARKGIRVGLIRPVDVKGGYPNRVHGNDSLDILYRTFEETGVICGMHTFVAADKTSQTIPWTAGQIPSQARTRTRQVGGLTTHFWFEAEVWFAQLLVSGFFDRYPKLKMAIYESNAAWVTPLLEQCDRLFDLYRSERVQPAKRKPSEAFYDQCIMGFEGDEMDLFRQWDYFEDVGIWASDSYHVDAMDAWTAIEKMNEVEVPERVQRKLMGGNAARAYGIEQKLFVTKSQEIPRPAWFPKEEDMKDWWEREKYPRKYGVKPAPHG